VGELSGPCRLARKLAAPPPRRPLVEILWLARMVSTLGCYALCLSYFYRALLGWRGVLPDVYAKCCRDRGRLRHAYNQRHQCRVRLFSHGKTMIFFTNIILSQIIMLQINYIASNSYFRWMFRCLWITGWLP